LGPAAAQLGPAAEPVGPAAAPVGPAAAAPEASGRSSCSRACPGSCSNSRCAASSTGCRGSCYNTGSSSSTLCTSRRSTCGCSGSNSHSLGSYRSKRRKRPTKPECCCFRSHPMCAGCSSMSCPCLPGLSSWLARRSQPPRKRTQQWLQLGKIALLRTAWG